MVGAMTIQGGTTMTVSEKTLTETAMTDLTVKVPRRLVEMARAQVASGRFANVDAVIEHALDEYDERERKLEHLRTLLKEGEDQLARGEYVEWTPTLMSEIAQEAREAVARGEKPQTEPWT